MTKKQKIGLAIFLIAIVALSPFFAGLFFQYQYQKDIQHLNTMDQMRVEVKSYKRNWQYSTTVLDVQVPLAVINFLTPAVHVFSNDEKINLTLTQKIDHGPFFYPRPANFHRFFGLAVIHNQWVLTQESNQLLQKRGFANLTVDKNNIYVSMLANYLIDLQLEKIRFQDPHKNTMLQLAAISLKSWFMPKEQRIQGNLQIKDIDIRKGGSQWTVPDLKFSFDQRATELALWTGALDLKIKRIVWRKANENVFLLADARFRGEIKKSANFVSLDRDIEIGQVQFNNQNIGPLHLQLNADKLNAKAISDVIMAYKLITQRGELYKNQLMQKIFLILPDVINPGANLDLKKFSLVTDRGQIQAKGKVFWPETNPASPDTLADFLKEVPLNVSLTVSAPLINTLIDLTTGSPYFNPYSLEEKSKILRLESDIDSAFQWNKQLLLQLSDARLINEDTETTLLFGSRDPDFSEYYLYQIRQLFLSREIPAYIAYLLYFSYGGFIFNANVVDELINKHTDDAKQFMLNLLNKAVDNGQVYYSGGQYMTVITRENEEIKLNGKIFSY